MEIAAVEGVAASIDRHAVPKRPGVMRSAPAVRWRRYSGADKPDKGRQRLQKLIFGENHSVFWSKSMAIPVQAKTCASHTSSPDLVDEI